MKYTQQFLKWFKIVTVLAPLVNVPVCVKEFGSDFDWQLSESFFSRPSMVSSLVYLCRYPPGLYWKTSTCRLQLQDNLLSLCQTLINWQQTTACKATFAHPLYLARLQFRINHESLLSRLKHPWHSSIVLLKIYCFVRLDCGCIVTLTYFYKEKL